MTEISYAGYRFPPEIIHQSIWLYLRFTLSFRDVEDLLAERGITVSYETVRRWVNYFGPMIAANLRKRRPRPHTIWHLDEAYLKIDGRMVYLWRAVDAEGEILDVLVQSKRNKAAALKLMRKLLKKYAFVPDRMITDDLRSYGAAARGLGIESRHERGRWKNNRAENSHQPTRRRERKMQGFKRLSAEISFYSRGDLQHLQRPAPSNDKADPQSPSLGGDEHVARCNRRCLKLCIYPDPLRFPSDNVSKPTRFAGNGRVNHLAVDRADALGVLDENGAGFLHGRGAGRERRVDRADLCGVDGRPERKPAISRPRAKASGCHAVAAPRSAAMSAGSASLRVSGASSLRIEL
jgi:transposase-like protein